MDLITDFKRSYEAHFNEPAPQVWQRPHKGYTIAYADGRRQTVTKRDLVLITALNIDMSEAVKELNDA